MNNSLYLLHRSLFSLSFFRLGDAHTPIRTTFLYLDLLLKKKEIENVQMLAVMPYSSTSTVFRIYAAITSGKEFSEIILLLIRKFKPSKEKSKYKKLLCVSDPRLGIYMIKIMYIRVFFTKLFKNLYKRVFLFFFNIIQLFTYLTQSTLHYMMFNSFRRYISLVEIYKNKTSFCTDIKIHNNIKKVLIILHTKIYFYKALKKLKINYYLIKTFLNRFDNYMVSFLISIFIIL